MKHDLTSEYTEIDLAELVQCVVTHFLTEQADYFIWTADEMEIKYLTLELVINCHKFSESTRFLIGFTPD